MNHETLPVMVMYQVLRVSSSGYHARRSRRAKLGCECAGGGE